MRVRVGVMLALAICVLFVPGSLYAHGAPPWFVTVKVAPPTGALIQLYAEGTFPYPITDDTRPIRLAPGEDTAMFVLPASAATDQWIYVRALPDLTPGDWIQESFWSPCRQDFHEEPWGPPPPDLPWWAVWPPPYPNGHWGFLCEPNEIEVEVRLPGPPPVAENRPQQTAQGPQDCLNLVGNPINVTTGNMYTQQEDLAFPSAFGRFAFTRTYNSQSNYSGPLGLGWTHPFDFELKELQPGVIRVRNGAGNVRFYELHSGKTDTFRPAAPGRDTSTLVKHSEGFTETERDGLSRKFDTSGRLTQIVTRSGWTTTLTYAGTQLESVTDPGGRTLSFTYYDGSGRLRRVQGPGSLTTGYSEYSYDPQGQLVAVADDVGTRWTYTYDTYDDALSARLTSVRDGNGNLVEEHTYDPQGRVIQTNAGRVPGSPREIEVKALTLDYLNSTQTQVTDSLGRVTIYTFEVFGNLPVVTQIQGPCACASRDSIFEYDSQGRLLATTVAQGNSTQREYDAKGNLIKIKVTDALGQVTTYTYNAFGQVLTTTDPTGATTSFTYDETTGFLRQVTNALGGSTTFRPDANNLPMQVIDPRGYTTTFLNEAAGLLGTLTDPTGAMTTFSYDTAGRLVSTTDALGGSTRYRYDDRGRLLSVTDPLGAMTQFQYDAAGNRVSLTDPKGRTTVYAYDTANRLVQVTEPAGGATIYAYDSEGNLVTVTDARGNTTTFTYDGHNRLIERTDPLGASDRFVYDTVGNLTSRSDRKGQTIQYHYDKLNRLIQKSLPDNSTVGYIYDELGRLRSATDTNGVLSFTYDTLGRVVTATRQDGRTLTYSYDPAGNRVSLRDEAGYLTTYAYDPRNLLITLTDPRAGVFQFTYDALGRRTRLTRPNGTSTNYTYDASSRLTGLTHRSRRRSLEDLTYSYDAAGNRTGDTRNHLRHQYTYDPLDQLTAVYRQDWWGHRHPEETYTYDPVGNRLTGPERQSYQYDAANRLTEDNTHAYAYDANGNITQQVRLKDGRITTYSYDAEDRLVRVVTPRTEVTFQFDPLGRRTEKRVVRWHDDDGDHEPDPDEEWAPRVTHYLYDQEDILATFNDAGREIARYTHGPGIDEPLAEMRRHRTRFYHADVLGSVIALTGEHGHPIRHYRYSAFGLPEDHHWDSQPYRYTGREWDREVGLYYYRARYYKPSLGRFIREDPIGFLGGPNLYAYVRNSPLNSQDPLGLQPFAVLAPSSTAPPVAPLSQPIKLTPAQARELGEFLRLFDPRPLGNFLLSQVLDKIGRGEPLTPEDIENLARPPQDLVCEIETPSAGPPPGTDPNNPEPPKDPKLRLVLFIAQLLRVIGRLLQ